MNEPTPESRAWPFEPDMFRGPERLDRLIAVMRAFPAPVGAATLAALAVADGLFKPDKFRTAVTWAAARGLTGWRGTSLALRLLANHGRFVANESMIGQTIRDLITNVDVEGREHLDLADGRGLLLLGFHLGPPKAWLTLRALGYPVRLAGDLSAGRDPRWQRALDAEAAVGLQGDSQHMLGVMYRLQRLLRQEHAVFYMSADGPFGRELFRLDLPGGPMLIRSGWFSLRRATGVRVVPTLTSWSHGRRLVTLYPPLPPVLADQQQDMAACRDVLAPLVGDFVNRFPAQCRWLAMPRWAAESQSPAQRQSRSPNTDEVKSP